RNNNRDAQLAAHAFLDGGPLGTHDLAAGLDRFVQDRYASNHQSGSNFSLFVTRVQSVDGVIYPVVTPSNANGGGTFIRWTPILVDARANDLRTDSAYVNDVWTPGRRWRLSLGARFDRNHATDADGTIASDDARLSPRLSVQYDLRGDGRQHLSASFADYTTLIADSVASSNQTAGNAAAIDFAYRGPAINDKALNTSMDDVIRMVFEFFNNTQGGTANRNANNLRANGSRTIPGYATYFDGTLASPYVRELTLGYGAQLGRNGYLRADLIHRDWHDFYVQSVTTGTRHTNTPLGIPVDLALIRNSNNVQRRYRGLQLQTRWTPEHFDIGAHYTWSTLRGNDEGETATNGALPNVDPRIYYPEYFGYERNAPVGYLSGDERHRLRAWAGYERLVGRMSVALSLLHSFDSGLPFSIAAPINLTRYAGAPANPGYNAVPNGIYYFSGRGELRTDDIQSTDAALRTAFRAGRVEWFAQGDVLNVFNRAGIADPTRISTAVTTAATSTTLQPFDPARETPVLGVHYQLAPSFGQPLNNLAYQTPRTWRISLGARF
ncbi:MAG TPA: TonB-dependent receptor, partial [Thermoanaerobaculia bacterium]|nr:TonB-dependent receptor [Thermoanaerobaculia bacterium]